MGESAANTTESNFKEELLTGIAKLVYKLSETVDGMNTRMENFEKVLSDLLKEGFSGLEKQVEKTNELLAGLKMPEGLLSEESFKKELGEVSILLSETTATLEKSVKESLEKSDGSRGEILEEKLKVIADSLIDIASKVEAAGGIIEKKLTEIREGTTSEVGQIDKSVKESAQIQKDQLEDMKELLTLHSVEIKDSKVKDLNRTAIMHFNNSEYDQAVSSLEEAIQLSPDSPELLANIAHIKAAQGNIDEAEKDFRAALEINPDLEPALSGLGIMLVHTGRASETIDFLKRFFQDDATPSINVMIAMSRAYTAQGNHTKAMELLEQAEKVAPGHPEVEQELANYRK